MEKVFHIDSRIEDIKDNRSRPRIKTSTIFRCILAMSLSRLGSLNALEQTGRHSFWRRWLREDLPSADTVSYVSARVEPDTIRPIIRHVYDRLKRNKALNPGYGNHFALIIDGHESSASYLHHCEGCLERTIHLKEGDKIQYYHRNVTAMLLCDNFHLLLDLEPQNPGEDEVAAAMRLIERVIKNYPRAFNVILADGLYVRAGFFNFALRHGKDVIAVLKDDRRELLKDARGLFEIEQPLIYMAGKTTIKCWDIENFTSWDSLEIAVRVVRSLETNAVCRQLTGEIEEKTSEWIWVTTISRKKLPTERFVELAHKRWAIENEGFNELVTYWHADHVYRHDPTAIESFWLMTMLAYNLFHAFFRLNLKPEFRKRHTKLHFLCMIASGLYATEIDGVYVPP